MKDGIKAILAIFFLIFLVWLSTTEESLTSMKEHLRVEKEEIEISSQAYISHENLLNTDTPLSAIKENYNREVQAYNELIEHFPTNIAATIAGYQTLQYFDD